MPVLFSRSKALVKSEAPKEGTKPAAKALPIPSKVLINPPVKATPSPVAAAVSPQKPSAVPKPLAVKPRPTMTFVVGGGTKISDQQKLLLAEAGLGEPTKKHLIQADKHDRIKVTNSLFPWAQHHKPGDEGTVIEHRIGDDPMGLDDGGKYHTYLIELDKPRMVEGQLVQKIHLFRWEFEILPSTYTPIGKGKVISGVR